MKFYVKKLYIFCTFLFVFISKNVYADDVYVFCATKNRKWQWLKIDNNYVLISGNWRFFSKPYNLNDYYYVRYFKINDSNKKIEELQNQCVKNFGPLYIYAQPAASSLSDWALMGVDDQNVAMGTFDVTYVCRSCFSRVDTFKLWHEFKANKNDLSKFMIEF